MKDINVVLFPFGQMLVFLFNSVIFTLFSAVIERKCHSPAHRMYSCSTEMDHHSQQLSCAYHTSP